MFLELKPTNRNNWIGLAMAHHMHGTHQVAIDILDKYIATWNLVKNEKEQDALERPASYDDSELFLYKQEILDEIGDMNTSLAHLEKVRPYILDTLVWRERKAACLVRLEKYPDALSIYHELLDINMDNYAYHRGLQAALCQESSWVLHLHSSSSSRPQMPLQSMASSSSSSWLPSSCQVLTTAQKATLATYYRQFPDSPTHARILLDLLHGSAFQST
jgi:tetratricopeptide (TPR) repeat protein